MQYSALGAERKDVPKIPSQRDEMGSGRRRRPDTCRCPVRATVGAPNCGAATPRFCLACMSRLWRHSDCVIQVAQQWLAASGKTQAWPGLLPAHGYPRMALSGELHCCVGPRFRRCMACGESVHGCLELFFDSRICSLLRTGADGGECPPRRCCQGAGGRRDTGSTTWTAHIPAVALIEARP